jgi:type VI secretion system protein ImpL
MKQLLLKILKVFLIIGAVLLGLLLVFGVVLFLDWPWWVGLFILLGLLGLGLGLVFFRKIWRRRREQRFVDQIIEQDDSHLKDLGYQERERSRELQGGWKEAIDALRHSYLKKYGNPLYVLPWYLVIGESGSGKTTAIKSARLSSPFADVSRTSGISGTRNCDWWFYEQAIIIDTAGRYAIPVDEGRDKDDWQQFLTLLAKYRKKEPLNGLVVTIAANKLLESGTEALEEDGRSIRRRIDQLMQVLGARFPVYVLVTKCDLIQGMTQFCDHLPEKALDQAMGLINYDLSTDVAAFHNRAMHTIGERLRDLRLLLLHKSQPRGAEQGIDPGLLLFPEESERLKPGLDAFIRGTFQENPYQETPILRGIFFSSGRQEGSPYSHFLQALGLIEEREVLPGTSKGLFLHEFFARILPKDRGLFAPTRRALEWSRLTRNLGLTAWVAVGVAICGLLSFSFVKNLKTLREASHEFSKPPVLQGDILTDVIIMDHFCQAILKVREENLDWWIPRFGLNESKEVEIQLKDKYCRQFQGAFLVSFDKEMANRMTNFSGSTPDEVIARYVAHLVRRINLLHARLEGETFETLQTKPQPSYEPVLVTADQKPIPEIREKLANLYLYYLVWGSDSTGLNQEMNDLQVWLKHILTLQGANLRWLVSLVNANESLAPVTPADFWGGSVPVSDETSVLPGFTRKGKEQIDSFVNEMESALPDALIIAGQKLEFQAWYRDSYFEAWRDFGVVFPKGVERLKGREEWQRVAARMATDQGPYFSLLDTMAAELEPLKRDEDAPSWSGLVYEFQATKAQPAQAEAVGGKSALAKATEKGKSLIAKLEGKGKKRDSEMSLEAQLEAAKAFREYEKALVEITPASASRAVAYQMATQVYGEDSATSKSPFFAARTAVDKLKAVMLDAKPADTFFWKVVAGPLDYLWAFVRMETACRLQELWEKDVLVEIQGVSDQKTVNQLLLAQDGHAMKFIKGPAEPFVNRSLRKGYHAKKALGEGIPFESAFFSFLTKGARTVRPVRDNYAVSIKGLPTSTNSEARVRPHATRLELQCAAESQKLINLNYPVRKTFNWSADACGDVILEIEVGNLILTKKYTGYLSLPSFLKDFVGGQRIFFPAEFPKKEAALKHLGIKYVKVEYQFEGHRPVAELAEAPPGRAPRTIAKCWGQ